MYQFNKAASNIVLAICIILQMNGHIWAQKNTESHIIALPAQTDTTDEYYSDNFIRYENHTYKKNIHSVQLINKAAEMSSAMIRFNSDVSMILKEDTRISASPSFIAMRTGSLLIWITMNT